jgi:hypothetical protein
MPNALPQQEASPELQKIAEQLNAEIRRCLEAAGLIPYDRRGRLAWIGREGVGFSAEERGLYAFCEIEFEVSFHVSGSIHFRAGGFGAKEPHAEISLPSAGSHRAAEAAGRLALYNKIAEAAALFDIAAGSIWAGFEREQEKAKWRAAKEAAAAAKRAA